MANTATRNPGIDAYPQRIQRYPFVPWKRLKPEIRWTQGEHIFTSGGTGSGKTTVSGELLPRRKLVAVCVSKGADKTLTGPYFKDYEIIRRWSQRGSHERVLLWPANGKTIQETRKAKQEIFREMFDSVLLHIGHWCIDIDELHYMAESLQLDQEITDLEEQGRSFDISIFGNTQRPAGIPLAVYVNAAMAFLFQTQEEYDVRRLGRLANRHTNAKEMMENIQRLSTHEFTFLDKSGRIPPCRSIVER